MEVKRQFQRWLEIEVPTGMNRIHLVKQDEVGFRKLLEISRRSVDVAGNRISLVDVGSGPVVLLLHGYPQGLLAWRHQISALSQTNRVIAPDWFGWGRSERTTKVIPEYWAEVERLDLLLDCLDVPQVHLVGHDYGGYLSLGLAIQEPARISSLSILNSRAHKTFPKAAYAMFALFCLAGRTPGLRGVAAALPLKRIHMKMVSGAMRAGVFSDEIADEYLGWLNEAEGRQWLMHYYRYYELPERPELAASLSSIACPTMLVWGDKDRFCPVELAEDLVVQLGTAELVRISGGNHFIMEERPDEVTDVLQSFFSRVSSQ